MGVRDFRGYGVANVNPNSTAYTSGDLIGGKLTLAGVAPYSGAGILIQKVALSDLAKQDAAVDVVFFNANPDGTTFTDNSALDVADADLPKVAGFLSIAAGDYCDFNDNSIANKSDTPVEVKLNGTSVLYAVVVARDTPTYASASDLQLMVETL